MASIPKHNYLKMIIDDIISEKKSLPKYKALEIMETTGPFMTTRIYNAYAGNGDVTLLPAELIAPLTLEEVGMLIHNKENADIEMKVENAFAIHYFLGSWISQTY